MKRTDLIRLLEGHGCEFLRRGSRHNVYMDQSNRRHAPVPRHREIAPNIVRSILKKLGIEIDPTKRIS